MARTFLCGADTPVRVFCLVTTMGIVSPGGAGHRCAADIPVRPIRRTANRAADKSVRATMPVNFLDTPLRLCRSHGINIESRAVCGFAGRFSATLVARPASKIQSIKTLQIQPRPRGSYSGTRFLEGFSVPSQRPPSDLFSSSDSSASACAESDRRPVMRKMRFAACKMSSRVARTFASAASASPVEAPPVVQNRWKSC